VSYKYAKINHSHPIKRPWNLGVGEIGGGHSFSRQLEVADSGRSRVGTDKLPGKTDHKDYLHSAYLADAGTFHHCDQCADAISRRQDRWSFGH